MDCAIVLNLLSNFKFVLKLYRIFNDAVAYLQHCKLIRYIYV